MAFAYYGIRQRVVQGFQCENAAISLHSGPFFIFFCPNDIQTQYLLVPFYALYSKTIVFNQIIVFKEEIDKKSSQKLIFFGRAICREAVSLLIFPPHFSPTHAFLFCAAPGYHGGKRKKGPSTYFFFPFPFSFCASFEVRGCGEPLPNFSNLRSKY